MLLDIVFGPLATLGPLFLRLALAWIFIVHGYPKLFTQSPGIKGFSNNLSNLGVPVPLFFACVVGLAEFFGGIALLVGVATRWAALLLAVNMVVAILKVTHKKGFTKGPEAGYEFNVIILAGALALLVWGPGILSADWALGVR